MLPFDFEKEHEINALVAQYEAMIRNRENLFLDSDAYADLIDYYEDQLQFGQALEVAERAIEQHRYSSEFYLRKARLLLSSKRLGEALAALDEAALFDAGDIDLYLLRAYVLAAQQDYEAAFSHLEQAKQMASEEDMSDLWLTYASVHEEKEDYNAMFGALRRSLLADPDNEEAIDRLWLCTEFSDNYPRSIRLYRQLIELSPYNATLWYNLGHVYMNTEQFAEAAEAFEYAYLIEEDFDFAYRACAAAHIEQGHYAEALSVLEDAVAHVAPDGEMMVQIGYCHEELQAYGKALQFYRKALEITPSYADAYYRMGEVYFKQEQWANAAQQYRQAYDLDGYREEFAAALAETYFQLNMIEEAARFFRRVVELAPGEAEYWLQFASFYMDVNNPEMGLSVLHEARGHTDGADLRYAEVACLLMMGLRRQAMAQLALALGEDAERHSVLFDLLPDTAQDAEIIRTIALYRR